MIFTYTSPRGSYGITIYVVKAPYVGAMVAKWDKRCNYAHAFPGDKQDSEKWSDQCDRMVNDATTDETHLTCGYLALVQVAEMYGFNINNPIFSE